MYWNDDMIDHKLAREYGTTLDDVRSWRSADIQKAVMYLLLEQEK